MENKHTQGEWFFKIEPKYDIIKIGTNIKDRSITTIMFTTPFKDQYVDNLESDGKEYPLDEAQANAKLIASAPELLIEASNSLETFELIKEWFDVHGTLNSQKHLALADTLTMIKRLESAIKKATE